MLFKPLAFAATAAAFLVVPEMADEPAAESGGEGIFKTLPFEPVTVNFPGGFLSKSVEIPCRKCKGKDTHINLDFDVWSGTALTLNGFELYPNTDPWHGDLVASVIKGNGKEKQQILGYSLAVTHEGTDADLLLEGIDIELRVIEVGNRFVDGVPAVNVKLLKTVDTNDLLIGNILIKEVSETECDSMWCRTKDMFGGLFKGIKGHKGCGGRHKAHKGNEAHNGHESTPVADGHREPSSPHQPEGDEDHHRWAKLFKNVLEYIFLPVLMGVAAGVGVAVIAMALCGIAVRLAALIRGKRSERSWCSRRRTVDSEEAIVDEEKSGLMEHQDSPPQYEDDSVKN